MGIKDILDEAQSRFSGLNRFVNEKYERLSFSLQQDVQGIVTSLIEKGIRDELLAYIVKPITLKDGTVLQGQSAFDRAVKEDKSIYGLVEKYRPSKLWYVRRARSIKQYIAWDSLAFAAMMASFLQENGVEVDEAGLRYLERECDRWRVKIYR